VYHASIHLIPFSKYSLQKYVPVFHMPESNLWLCICPCTYFIDHPVPNITYPPKNFPETISGNIYYSWSFLLDVLFIYCMFLYEQPMTDNINETG